jgi:chromosome segregation ATPase
METLDKSIVAQRIQGHRAMHRGADMEARMARVETTIGHILKDLDSIKREIRELRAYVDERFRQFEANVDERFRQLEAKFDARFAKVDARFAELEARIDARFAKVDARFAELEARIDARFAAFESSMRTEFRLVWAGMFAIVGILAKGFHWI